MMTKKICYGVTITAHRGYNADNDDIVILEINTDSNKIEERINDFTSVSFLIPSSCRDNKNLVLYSCVIRKYSHIRIMIDNGYSRGQEGFKVSYVEFKVFDNGQISIIDTKSWCDEEVAFRGLSDIVAWTSKGDTYL